MSGIVGSIRWKARASGFRRALTGYRDRGHWIAHVEGIATIDHADFFPRYFMDLDRAKLEMQEWLAWRIACEERTSR